MIGEPAVPGASLREAAWVRTLRLSAEALAIASIAVLVLVPLVDHLLAIVFMRGIRGAGGLADHAVLVLAFASAALATLDGRQLSLSAPPARKETKRRRGADFVEAFSSLMAAAATAAFLWAALSFVPRGFEAGAKVWIIPLRLLASSMPLGFLLMILFSLYRARGRPLVLAAYAAGLVLGSLIAAAPLVNFTVALLGTVPSLLASLPAAAESATRTAALPLCLLFGASALAGAPLFSAMSGIAAVLFASSGGFMELAPSEAYSLLRGGSITAVPLFALVGLVLAGSGAGRRLVALLHALFGWIRGGEAIVAVLACAFFTTFTGASGVTILALGGMLAAALAETGAYREGSARGLIAASGAIGLLLPPSAAVIVYGVNAQFIYGESAGFDVTALFKGGLVPGLLLVLAMCAAGVLAAVPGRKAGGARQPGWRGPDLGGARKAIGPAALELALPLVAAGLYFTGFAGLAEIGAICVLYVVLVESVLKRELKPRALLGVLRSSLPILGGTLIVLAAARGLSFYIIDADLPTALAAWVTERVHSPFVFLLALNLMLLATGCLMDIFSAILVVAPLVIPLGAAFGIDPVHFGVVFILNLCIGFITPPVGLNLFLASYAFGKPLSRIVREVLPFLAAQLAVLAAVTYLPVLSSLLR